jgi:hypothetical protein
MKPKISVLLISYYDGLKDPVTQHFYGFIT